MNRQPPTFSDSSLALATRSSKYRVQEVLDYAAKLAEDPEKDDRLATPKCKACFYSPPRMAGAAVTMQPCACCGTSVSYGSTNTDLLCYKCAYDNELCKHCGSDVHMRTDRKVWPKGYRN